MLRIKRLYLYILQEFLPMFFMTFAICLFILLMQFLWKYVEDLVGKGLDTVVLAELFFYAILSIIPMALPLAILLASLMTFGNLGERFELTAIKAAGISLFRAMQPLIIVIIFVSFGAFFFQNEAMPKINVKISSLLRSIKMKSPELDIPEGSFYNEIENYNLFVREKNKDTGILYDVIIYDVSEGFDKMKIIVCDSAELRMASTKDYLLFTLYYGQQFVNFDTPGQSRGNQRRNNNSFVPYSRENFRMKDIIIPFDANFNRMDETNLQGSQIAKNIKELQFSIDSLSQIVDSLNIRDRNFILNSTFRKLATITDTTETANNLSAAKINIDSVIKSLSTSEKVSIYSKAVSSSEMNRNDLFYRSMSKSATKSDIRYHKVEWHRKFTLSFACLIFFFIGAPLGAIIRKGGLGMPVVISVILFIFYYIIDNVGRKMARDGVWDVWQGIWLSSVVLFPLGVFLTYKAMNDSALFNMDAYRNMYFRIFGDPKTKSGNKLSELFVQNTTYLTGLYFTVLISLIGKFILGGFLSSLIGIIMWISLAVYIVLFIKTFIDWDAFNGKCGIKTDAKQQGKFFVTAFLLPFVILKNEAAKMNKTVLQTTGKNTQNG